MKSSRFWSLLILAWLAVSIACLRAFLLWELPIYIFLTVFWLYGLFNLAVFLTSQIITPEKPAATYPVSEPRVTVLYCCFNDFNQGAALSLVNLTYSNKDILILDDSTDQSVRKCVDSFASAHDISVVRRDSRKGWKAGAINNTLSRLSSDYVVLSDSDEFLPADFVERTLLYFKSPETAFVQANHRCCDKSNEWTEFMGIGVDLHWNHYQEYRNRYGLVQILGHGVMIRTEVLKRFGLPEVVSEDLALTFRLSQANLRGVFAKEVMCGETFPANYSAFRRRHKKWCQGSAQLMKGFIPSFLASKNVRWYEKADAVLATFNLPLMVLLPAFLLLSLFIKPAAYSDPAVIAISITTILSPMLIFLKAKGSAVMKVKTIVLNLLAHGSLCALSIAYVLKGFLKSTFLVTNVKSARRYDSTLLLDISFGLFLSIIAFPNLLGFILLMSPLLWWKYK